MEIAVDAEEGELITAVVGPLICVQMPVPETGTFAFNVAVVVQTAWSAPAAATVAGASTVICTVSTEERQTPLEIVHWNTYVPAAVKPLTAVTAEPGAAIIAVAGPLICVHCPLPIAGVFPFSVASPGAAQTAVSFPASAVVGRSYTTTCIVSLLAEHGALSIVQTKVYVPATRFVIGVVSEDGVVIVAVFGPLSCDQVPVPTAAAFALIVADVAAQSD